MAIKVYSPIDFEDTSSGLSIDGDFAVDTNTFFVDVSTDKVGIGTSNPAKTLSVVGAPYDLISWQRTSQTTGYLYSDSAGVGMYTGSSFSEAGIYMRANTSMDFRVNGTQRIHIDSSGKVGIGTTSPSYELDVNGEINSTGIVISSQLILDTSSVYTRLRNPEGTIALYLGDSGDRTNYYDNNAHRFRGVGGSGDKMFINSSGNVGIGTTSPSYKLEIKGTSNNIGDGNQIFSVGNTSGGTQLAIGSSENSYTWIRSYESGVGGRDLSLVTNGEAIRIKSGGNVLIGTNTDSGYKLDVNGTARFTDSVTISSSGAPKDLTIYGNTAGEFMQYDASASSLNIYGKSNSPALGVFVNGGAQPTDVQLKVGRDTGQYYGIKVDDNTASLIHRQDESSTNVHQVFNEIWSSASGDHNWRWNTKDRDGYSNSEKMRLTSGSVLTLGGGSNTITDSKVGQWDTAYGWGDHASAGYLTSYTETDTLDSVTDRGTSTTNSISVGGLTVNGSSATIGNSSQQSTYLDIIATNTAGAPAWTTAIKMQGYDGRGQGIFFTDTANVNEEWFAGINYGNSWDTYSIGYDASGGQAEYTANAILTVKNNGNVGIGTWAPVEELDVAGTARMDTGITEGIHYAGTGFQHWGDGGTGIDFPSNDVISLKTSSADRLFINSSGYVGVGTTSPQKAFEAISGGNNFVSVGVQRLGVGQWAGIHFGYREANASYRKSAIVFERTDLTSNNAQGKIHILNGPQSGAGSATLADAKLTIAENGNVGIGTTSPTEELHVEGEVKIQPKHTTGTPPSLYLGDLNNQYQSGISSTIHLTFRSTSNTYFQTGGANYRMMIDSTGKVGIGTISPDRQLQVHESTSGTSTAKFTNSTTGEDGDTGFLVGINGSEQPILFGYNSTDMIIGTNGTERMRITSTGNVGIGTTSPTKKLHVEGTTKITGDTTLGTTSSAFLQMIRAGANYIAASDVSGELRFRTGGSSDRLTITSSGNVGIGTTSPSYKLDVSGTARAVKSKIDITPTSDTIALDIRGTGTPNDYFTVSNATGGANDVFLPIFFYKAATYGYNGGTNRYPSGVYGGGFVAAVDDTSYPSAAGAGAAMHFNARTYANNGPLTNRYLFSWGSWLTTHMAMTAGGNLLIGKTTDSGEELQVNGSADVSGDINADGDFYQNGAQGWSGTINIPTNPPIAITVQGGIITNVT